MLPLKQKRSYKGQSFPRSHSCFQNGGQEGTVCVRVRVCARLGLCCALHAAPVIYVRASPPPLPGASHMCVPSADWIGLRRAACGRRPPATRTPAAADAAPTPTAHGLGQG